MRRDAAPRLNEFAEYEICYGNSINVNKEQSIIPIIKHILKIIKINNYLHMFIKTIFFI